MSDGENTLEIENLDTSALGEEAAEETPENPAEEPEKVPTEEETAEQEAEAALAAEKATPGEGEEVETPEYKADFKFKADGKEHEIPELFRGVITDEKTEKEVKSFFSKAFGSDALIERNKKLETNVQTTSEENTRIKGGIDGLRQIYVDSTKHPSEGGNILKMDQFFKRLNIPENVILNYAVAKVQLQEMPPEQRNAIVAQMDAENKANALTMERSQIQGQGVETSRRLKALELDQQLASSETQALAKSFDERLGKPGSFKEAVIRQGELAWFRQQIDLTPDQAIKAVVEAYGITPSSSEASASPKAPSGNPAGGQTRPIVKRTDKVIPNVQGKGSQSPLKSKPRSIEDLKKLSKQAAEGSLP